MTELQNKIQIAIDEISSFLLDNTEGGFEEIPELDMARTELQEAQELIGAN